MSAQQQNRQTQQSLAAPPQASATTCIVGCKLPHGLQLELTRADGKVIRHALKGRNAARIVGGYGFTDGIPTEFMQEWLKQNEDHPAVKNGSIFIHTTASGAEGRAREGREIRTGFDPIHPVEDAKRHGIQLDAEAIAAYNRQVAENPLRNQQIVE